MCEGESVLVEVVIPADLAAEGKDTLKLKPIDRCIAPIVEALAAAGIRTRGSCCGHGKGPGSILLQDGRELLVVTPSWRRPWRA